MPIAELHTVPLGAKLRRPRHPFTPSGRKGGGKGAAANFRAPVEQPDSAQSTSVAHVLDILCEGPIGGLYAGLKSVFYDDTPIMNADGSVNFDGVSIALRPGTTDQEVIPGFFRTENEVVVGLEATIETGGAVSQIITDKNVNLVRVKVILPDGLMQIITDQESPNYGDVVSATVEFRIQVSVDAGSFEDIDGSPFTIHDKTSANYELAYEFELPFAEDSWTIRLVRVTEDSTASTLRNRTTFGTVTEITTGRINYADTAVIGQIVNAEQFGDRIPARSVEIVGVEVLIPSNYDPVEHTYDPEIWDGSFVTAATENPVWHLYNLLTNTRYGCGQDIPEELIDKLALYEIARYCDGRVPSSIGKKPQFVDTPGGSPYNLSVSMGLHGYAAGDWIWITGSIYEEFNGLWQIDYADQNFFTIYAGLLVPHFDNNPNLLVYSTEPRFTFNALFNVQQTAFALISAISSCFRAMPYWATGGVAFSHDAPTDFGRIVTRANTIDGEFVYSGPALKDRASAVKVTWIDPQDGYRPAVEYVEDADLINRFGLNEIDVYAVGATTRSQARRHGIWMLLTQKYCSEVLTYRAGLDNAHFRPGEVIHVNDPAQAGVRNGGQVAALDSPTSATEVTLDSGVDLAEGHSYTLAVMMSDGTVEERDITNSAGDGITVITVDPAFSATEILTGAIWGISGTDVALRPFRVVGVREIREDQFEVTCVAHEPDIYDAIDFGGGVTEIDFTDIPTGPLTAPTNLVVHEYQYFDTLTLQPRALFSWTRSTDARVTMYELQIMRPGQLAWEPYDRAGGITQGVSGVVVDAIDGVYLARVRGRDNLGRTSPWFPSAAGAEFVLSGLHATPSDVENFRTSISIQRMKLLWDPVPDLILDHYEIRFSPALVGATWAGALPVGPPIGKDTLTYSDVVLTGTYFIKAISVLGVESANATTIIVDVIGNINLNQIQVVEEHPTFPGVKDDVEVVGDYLELAGDTGAYLSEWSTLAEVITLATGVGEFSPTGRYHGSVVVDLGSVFDVRVTPEIHGDGYNIYNVMQSWITLSEVSNLAGYVEGEVGLEFLVDITADDPTDLGAVWEGYKPLIGADVRARGIRWALDFWTTKAWVTPRVNFFAVSIDMYDRILDGKDLPTTGGELVVDFTPPFRGSRPSAVVTVQNGEQGDYVTIRNSTDTADGPDADGMIVRVFDLNGDPVERTIDYHVKGYGAVIT